MIIQPLPVASLLTPAFTSFKDTDSVFAGFDLVLVGAEVVETSVYTKTALVTETKYLTIVFNKSGDAWFTFSNYQDPDHYDWASTGEIPVDAESILLTGWVGGGDFIRNKEVPFLMMHFYKTEDGFIDDDSDFIAKNQSSCFVQSQWGWSNHVNSGKWGTPFQAYRFSRFWAPDIVSDNFDNGFYTVETRNKLRGSGRVLSLQFTSEPGKHMNIIGWSMALNMRAGV